MRVSDCIILQNGKLRRNTSCNESYKEMEIFVKNILITNDAAERGIKMISDYANSLTKDNQDRENLLQLVEQHRKEYPDQNKATISKGFRKAGAQY